MITPRFWDAITGWTLPAIVVLTGLLPPHVYPDLALPLSMAALLLLAGLAGSEKLASPGRASGPLAVCAGILVLSTYTSLSPLRSVRLESSWLAAAIVFAAAYSFAPGGPAARRAIAAIVLLGALLGALGIYQSIFLFPAMSGEEVTAALPALGSGTAAAEAARVRVASARALGTLGLPALLAAVLVVGLPLAAGEGAARKGWARVPWLAAAAVQAIALAATRSMGGLAALILSGAAVAAILVAKGRRRAAPFVAALAVALLAGGAAVAPRLLASGPGSAREAVAQRTENWKAAVAMAADNPLLGVGPGNFGVALPAYRSAATNETQHAHSCLLELASDAGLFIVPFALLALAVTIRIGVRVLSEPSRADPAAAWRARALALAAAAWTAQSFVDFGAYVAAVLIPFAVAAGLLVRAGSRSPLRPAGIPTRSLLLAAAVAAALLGIPDAVSRRDLRTAVLHAAAGEEQAAIDSARGAAAWNPFDPEAHAFLSQALVTAALPLPLDSDHRRGLVTEAVFEAEEAVRLDPATANRRAASARARAAAGDGAGAYADMAMAARLNPLKAEYASQRDALMNVLLKGGEEAGGGPP